MKTLFLFTFIFFTHQQKLLGQKVENHSNAYTPSDSITIANGTKISYAEFKKSCVNAWNASFGQMSEADKKRFQGINLEISTDEKRRNKPQ